MNGTHMSAVIKLAHVREFTSRNRDTSYRSPFGLHAHKERTRPPNEGRAQIAIQISLIQQ